MATASEKVVQDFCAAWARKNIDELLSFFTPDAIRETINMFAAPAESITFEMRAIASAGDTVFTERVDHFKMMGKTISLPVAGVFEVRNGKIAAWRDYFDMQTYMKQSGMGG
jgi:limonene-1,2-epoxide hydrolase